VKGGDVFFKRFAQAGMPKRKRREKLHEEASLIW